MACLLELQSWTPNESIFSGSWSSSVAPRDVIRQALQDFQQSLAESGLGDTEMKSSVARESVKPSEQMGQTHLFAATPSAKFPTRRSVSNDFPDRIEMSLKLADESQQTTTSPTPSVRRSFLTPSVRPSIQENFLQQMVERQTLAAESLQGSSPASPRVSAEECWVQDPSRWTMAYCGNVPAIREGLLNISRSQGINLDVETASW